MLNLRSYAQILCLFLVLGNSRVFQRGSKGVSRKLLFQESFKGVLSKFHWYSKEVSRSLQECFHGVSRKIEGCFELDFRVMGISSP